MSTLIWSGSYRHFNILTIMFVNRLISRRIFMGSNHLRRRSKCLCETSHTISVGATCFSSSPSDRPKTQTPSIELPAAFTPHRKTNRVKMQNVNVYKNMSIQELADVIEKPVDHVYACLSSLSIKGMQRGNANQVLDLDVIKEICKKSGIRANVINRSTSDKKVEEVSQDVSRRPDPDPSVCKPRPPVVTIMGHVDHGKTTLLDYLRKSHIVDQEFGGITQHIGAFSVKLKHGKSITFLDTPGHAAFSAMRGRGAKLTDIIVLVVAADDGVMPQTIESIKHAMNSNVPIVVAINKCDRPEALADVCVQDLAQNGVKLEEVGGEILGVKISALKGMNVDALQDAIITQAEMLDLKADYGGLVEGRIIESRVEPGRGKLASVLVQRGTLKPGACLVASSAFCKVKSLLDEHGKVVKSAGPGTAVEVLGWKELPSSGIEVLQVENESKMKKVISFRKLQEQKLKEEEDWNEIKQKRAEHEAEYQQHLKLRQDMALRRYTGEFRRVVQETKLAEEAEMSSVPVIPVLPLAIRADVDGSLEAILSCLDSYTGDLCHMKIITSGVGDVTENDVELMKSCDGVVIAFNTGVPDNVGKLANENGVSIRNHNIIYRLVDDVKQLLNDKVPMRIEHKTLGEALIQKVFYVTEKINGKSLKIPVAGCKCIQGSLLRNNRFKLVRGTQVVHDDTLYSLKHFKSEVPDIKEGMECGLAFTDHSIDIQEADVILCYEEFEYKPEIEWILPF